jgi:hypothetical protein
MAKAEYHKKFFTILLLLSSAWLLASEPDARRIEAMRLLAGIESLPPSKAWPEVAPHLFLNDLKDLIANPERVMQGKATNFCGYAATTYLLVLRQPDDFAIQMLRLYKHGETKFGKARLNPGRKLRLQVGTLHAHGQLDSLHAQQMWFMTLADHFKGYVNWLDNKYTRGDENRFWAGTNFAKFNRMTRVLTNQKIYSEGNDLIQSEQIANEEKLKKLLQKGDVVLMTNNLIKKETKRSIFNPRLPAHFIVLKGIHIKNSQVLVEFWDYGTVKTREFSKRSWKKTIHGVTVVENEVVYARN